MAGTSGVSDPFSSSASSVATGAGTAAAASRVTLASDDPAVVALGTMPPGYTEDAAAPANPVGGVQQLVRKDTPADEVSADGDIISRRSNKYGAAYSEMINSTGGKLDYRNGPDTATNTQVASVTTAGGVAILASNASRLGAIITNTDANALNLWKGVVGTVTGTAGGRYHIRLAQGASLILKAGDYTGAIVGIWDADGSGAAEVSEDT